MDLVVFPCPIGVGLGEKVNRQETGREGRGRGEKRQWRFDVESRSLFFHRACFVMAEERRMAVGEGRLKTLLLLA